MSTHFTCSHSCPAEVTHSVRQHRTTTSLSPHHVHSTVCTSVKMCFLVSNILLLKLYLSALEDRWPGLTFWQRGLTFWSGICSLSAWAEEDTNLWSADHIASYYVSLAAEEQHLFRVPGSPENNVSEPVDFSYTRLVVSPSEISWLVPRGGNVNRYFRSADVWVIRFVDLLYATLKTYCILRVGAIQQQTTYLTLCVMCVEKVVTEGMSGSV